MILTTTQKGYTFATNRGISRVLPGSPGDTLWQSWGAHDTSCNWLMLIMKHTCLGKEATGSRNTCTTIAIRTWLEVYGRGQSWASNPNEDNCHVISNPNEDKCHVNRTQMKPNTTWIRFAKCWHNPTRTFRGQICSSKNFAFAFWSRPWFHEQRQFRSPPACSSKLTRWPRSTPVCNLVRYANLYPKKYNGK